jgi:hypothetical protein
METSNPIALDHEDAERQMHERAPDVAEAHANLRALVAATRAFDPQARETYPDHRIARGVVEAIALAGGRWWTLARPGGLVVLCGEIEIDGCRVVAQTWPLDERKAIAWTAGWPAAAAVPGAYDLRGDFISGAVAL